jgi:hypothetical protein
MGGCATLFCHVREYLAVTRDRYLHFDNIDLYGGRAITASCNACDRQFIGKPVGNERTDDVVLRVRIEFDAHQCEDAERPIPASPAT